MKYLIDRNNMRKLKRRNKYNKLSYIETKYSILKEIDKDYYEPNIISTINGRRFSYYNCVIKDRVFDHNMMHGLTFSNFRNFYSKLKLGIRKNNNYYISK